MHKEHPFGGVLYDRRLALLFLFHTINTTCTTYCNINTPNILKFFSPDTEKHQYYIQSVLKYYPIKAYTTQSYTNHPASVFKDLGSLPKLWGFQILNLPIRFGMDVWYCLGRDHSFPIILLTTYTLYSSGLWECG